MKKEELEALLYELGSIERVAKKVNQHPGSIYRLMQEMGIPTPRRVRIKESKGEIFQQLKQGVKPKILSRKYGLSQHYIRKIGRERGLKFYIKKEVNNG